MHFHTFSLGLVLAGVLSTNAAPAPYTTSANDAGGITVIGSGSLQPGTSTIQNYTVTDITNGNSTGGSPANSDFWEIRDKGLELVIDQFESSQFEKAKLMDVLNRAASKARGFAQQVTQGQRPAEVPKRWDFPIPNNDAVFGIEPTISRVLTWADVVVIIKGLTDFYTTTNRFEELTFAVDEQASTGDRGRFAQGSVRRLRPTPPSVAQS